MPTRVSKTPGSDRVFFANLPVLRALRNRIVKAYRSGAGPLLESGVWLPVAPTRADAYSLAMLLIEALGEQVRFRVCCPNAAAAVYREPDLEGLTPARRQRFFRAAGGAFRPARLLADRVASQCPFQHLESLHDAIVALDSQLRVLFVNDSYCRLFHVESSELVAKPLLGAGPGQWKPLVRGAELRQHSTPGEPGAAMEIDVAAAGAGIVSLDILASDWSRAPVRLLAIRNETSKGMLAEELDLLRFTVDALLEPAPKSILAVLPNGTIVLANGNTREMFGYSKEELAGRPLTLLIPKVSLGRQRGCHGKYFEPMDLRALSTRSPNLLARRKNGSTFPVEIGMSAISSGGEKLAIVIIQNVTGRGAMEEAIFARGAAVQSLAASLLTAKEEIERRVSRELHDQICQPLAALAIDLGALAAEAASPGCAATLVKSLQVRAVQVSEQARHMAYELHPSVLDDLGLVASMRALCDEFSRRLGLAVVFRSENIPSAIPREVASCLYRVTQESLQNVLNHARASEISVSLSRRRRTLTVRIADNGAGFAVAAAHGRGGLGLIGMEERARLVSGRVAVDSSPGRGTAVTLEVPLGKWSAAP